MPRRVGRLCESLLALPHCTFHIVLLETVSDTTGPVIPGRSGTKQSRRASALTKKTLNKYTFFMSSEFKELYDRGRELYEEGKYDEAEWLLREVIKIKPDYADVLNKLGLIASLKDDYDAAVDYLKKALELNPSYTEASLNLAITYNERGEIDKAQEVFANASKIADVSPQGLDPFVAGKIANEHFKLGNMYFDFSLYDDAIEEFRKALKLKPNLADVHTNLGIAYRNRDQHDLAMAHFEEAKAANPYFGAAWVQLGLTYHMKGMTERAIEEWENALKQNPNIKEARSFLKLLKPAD